MTESNIHSPRQVNKLGQVVVKVGKRDLVLGSNLLTDDDLVDVVELVPVFISIETKTKVSGGCARPWQKCRFTHCSGTFAIMKPILEHS